LRWLPNRRPPAFVFVESNTTGTGELFLNHACERYRTFLLVSDRKRYRFLDRIAATVVDCDTRDLRSLKAAVSDLARSHRIEGVWSTSEYFISEAIALARSYGLKLGSSSAVSLARDKSYQRRAFAAAGLGHVRSSTCHAADAPDAAREIGYPVVIKPLNGSGSVGVRLIENERELVDHLVHVDGAFLIEEYIDGPQFSLELFSLSPIGITAQHYGPPPTFIAVGHDFPALIEEGLATRIIEDGRRAAAALNLVKGPVHVELRLQRGQVRIIEVNPRLAGGFIPELVRRATGTDLIAQTCAFAAGRTPDLKPVLAHHSSIRFIVAPGPGRLDGIRFPRFAVPDGMGVETQCYVPNGAELERHGDFRDRVGHVIAWSAEPGYAPEIAALLQQHTAMAVTLPSDRRQAEPEPLILSPERK
jgi:argininosuccinate lyase